MNYCHEICELLEIRGYSEPQDSLATGLVYTYASGLPRLVIANAVAFDHGRVHGPSEGAQRPKKALSRQNPMLPSGFHEYRAGMVSPDCVVHAKNDECAFVHVIFILSLTCDFMGG